MSTEVEFWYERNRVLMIGDVTLSDASFDHPFGREKVTDFDVDNFAILVYINGIDYDLTKGFTHAELILFKKRFEEHVRENWLERLKAKRDFDHDPEAA